MMHTPHPALSALWMFRWIRERWVASPQKAATPPLLVLDLHSVVDGPLERSVNYVWVASSPTPLWHSDGPSSTAFTDPFLHGFAPIYRHLSPFSECVSGSPTPAVTGRQASLDTAIDCNQLFGAVDS